MNTQQVAGECVRARKCVETVYWNLFSALCVQCEREESTFETFDVGSNRFVASARRGMLRGTRRNRNKAKEANAVGFKFLFRVCSFASDLRLLIRRPVTVLIVAECTVQLAAVRRAIAAVKCIGTLTSLEQPVGLAAWPFSLFLRARDPFSRCFNCNIKANQQQSTATSDSICIWSNVYVAIGSRDSVLSSVGGSEGLGHALTGCKNIATKTERRINRKQKT